MTDTVAGVVLAAGSGSRLLPLTDILPKPLCPVANVALVDHAISRIDSAVDDIAVNAWHHADKMVEHLQSRVHLSVEVEPLGTAGALGNLRPWIDGRAVMVHNADSWQEADLEAFVDGWDGERVRLLVNADTEQPDFGTWRFCGVSLLPWHFVRQFEATPSGLWECLWKDLWQQRALDLVPYEGPFFDCGTPRNYLEANLLASGADNVIGEGAIVKGRVHNCVLWPGATVDEDEVLDAVIRAANGTTVQC